MDKVQPKAYAQAQEEHVQTGAGPARTKGMHKHSTCAHRHRLSLKTNRLTDAQKGARYTNAGTKHEHTQGDMQCKHEGKGTGLIAGPCHGCGACARILSMAGLAWCINVSMRS